MCDESCTDQYLFIQIFDFVGFIRSHRNNFTEQTMLTYLGQQTLFTLQRQPLRKLELFSLVLRVHTFEVDIIHGLFCIKTR